MTDFTLTVSGYGVLLFGLLMLELRARRHREAPAARDVLGWLMVPRLGRWAVLFGWWWLGWHFFVRGV